MARLNVKNGTPVGTENLCTKCTWAQCMTGYRESDVLVLCTHTDPNIKVPFTVAECSEFSDRFRPTWEQMTKLAIEVAPARITSRTTGFSAVTKVTPIRRADEDDEDEETGEIA